MLVKLLHMELLFQDAWKKILTLSNFHTRLLSKGQV